MNIVNLLFIIIITIIVVVYFLDHLNNRAVIVSDY